MARSFDQPIDSGPAAVTGIAAAIVVQNDDPEGLGRVRLLLPWLDADAQTGWARLAVPFGAPTVVPAIGDEVLVAFEQGDVRFPYVLGRLPNRQQP
jgi:uncharacterized protein involved in type VI secretion and phage assembly